MRYGVQTTDEMPELWIQVLAATPADHDRPTQDFGAKGQRDNLTFYQWLLRENPRDARAHTSLGRLLVLSGQMDEAAKHLRAALEIFPGDQLRRETLDEILRARGMRP